MVALPLKMAPFALGVNSLGAIVLPKTQTPFWAYCGPKCFGHILGYVAHIAVPRHSVFVVSTPPSGPNAVDPSFAPRLSLLSQGGAVWAGVTGGMTRLVVF